MHIMTESFPQGHMHNIFRHVVAFNFLMHVTIIEECYMIFQELQSVRGQLLAEQSRCFKLEVCDIQETYANFVW